ncbi:MAG: DUF3617 family protein [Sphingomonas sp.]|uniref:DUF3617 domain-containing protein n=1 Tax=Sphingomonas sp. TaxID=28214 RepID=UPI0012122E19|nr:DUF3617 domain-containing protein [Sphingomonas sp.]THD37853.1 MAG: DUF3617 family protein [Sphingomonas sp.]
MRSPVLIAPLTLALAACSQHSSTTTTTADGNTTTTTTATTATTPTTPTTATTTTTTTTATGATGADVPSAASLGLQPGKWETTVAIQEMTVNGVNRTPPGGASQKATSCLTAEQAAKGPGEFLKAAGGQCTATSSNFGGGRMDVEMACKMPMGMLKTKSTGTYTPTSMSSDAVGSVSGRMSITERVHTEARRIGACN